MDLAFSYGNKENDIYLIFSPLMRLLSIIVVILVLCNCKSEPKESTPEDKGMVALGIENYEDLVRHPISMQSDIDSSDWPKIDFVKEEFQFDTISHSDEVDVQFAFQNNGSKALYILDTKVSCGCTVVDFPEQAILPKEKGIINVKFNAEGKSGKQERSIIVISNGIPQESILWIKGFVKN